jgi:DNA-binding transcriptional regulator LsrR (DeoR family)
VRREVQIDARCSRQRAALSELAGRGACPRCAKHGRACPSCAQRRHRAWRLVDVEQLTVEVVAERMGLAVPVVRSFVAEERDRRDLRRYKRDSIPTARVRAFLERELERDPGLTRAEVAHWMNMLQVDFDRQLGYTLAKGRRQRRVGVQLASRLTLALGRAPNELEGC